MRFRGENDAEAAALSTGTKYQTGVVA
jgi:hypothetical protein